MTYFAHREIVKTTKDLTFGVFRGHVAEKPHGHLQDVCFLKFREASLLEENEEWIGLLHISRHLIVILLAEHYCRIIL